jgi:hypothetical protein
LAVGGCERSTLGARSAVDTQKLALKDQRRRDSAVYRVADLLIKQPVSNAQVLKRELGISTGNARRYIHPSQTLG